VSWRARCTLVACTLAIAAPSRARADDDRPAVLKMRFVERGEDLTVTAGLTQLFDNAAFLALSSGFVTTVEIQTWVYPRSSTSPIAYQKLVRSVVYDMWDELYTVKPCETCKPIRVRSPAEALKLVTSLDDEMVAKLVDIPYEDVYYLAIRADLNPIDKRTLTEVRRWLSQGTGGGLDRGGEFFGSFVSVFVNPKIAESDRVLRVRSQPFFRPTP
jgi:hypothetical protein